VTVEGISQLSAGVQNGQLHPLQQAFIDEGAVQCGYCTPGFIVAGAALLSEHPHPTEAQIREGVSGNLCRCTGYYKILSAFDRAIESTSVPDEVNETTHAGPVQAGAHNE
jgi:carbon-monoxide dehydrogenase small subunit